MAELYSSYDELLPHKLCEGDGIVLQANYEGVLYHLVFAIKMNSFSFNIKYNNPFNYWSGNPLNSIVNSSMNQGLMYPYVFKQYKIDIYDKKQMQAFSKNALGYFAELHQYKRPYSSDGVQYSVKWKNWDFKAAKRYFLNVFQNHDDYKLHKTAETLFID